MAGSEANSDWKLSVIESLRDRPRYVLTFAICILIGGSGTGVLTTGVFRGDWKTGAVGAFTIVVMLAFVLLMVGNAKPSRPRSPTARALIGELDKVRSLILRPLEKRNLSFEITFLRLADDSRRFATVRLKCTYQLDNASSSSVPFPFTAQVDVSERETGSVSAILSVVNLLTGQSAFPERSLALEQTSGPRFIERLYEEELSSPPWAKYQFEWETSEYEVDLPYAEFWATANPALNVSINVISPGDLNIHARADCYRISDDRNTFRRSRSGPNFQFDAFGAFLPFQGIFLRVHREHL